MSHCDPTLTHPISPPFSLTTPPKNTPKIHSLLRALNLEPHPEGGYFRQTDRDPRRVPNPFKDTSAADHGHIGPKTSTASAEANATRNASTSILYYFSPERNGGFLHRNRARTVHTVQWGRGRYVVLHADEVRPGSRAKVRIETFVVGTDVEAGEQVQWIVEGGKYKASFLLPDVDGGQTSERGLLVSEIVMPGFEFSDHDFLGAERFEELLTKEQQRELRWLVRGEKDREGFRMLSGKDDALRVVDERMGEVVEVVNGDGTAQEAERTNGVHVHHRSTNGRNGVNGCHPTNGLKGTGRASGENGAYHLNGTNGTNGQHATNGH